MFEIKVYNLGLQDNQSLWQELNPVWIQNQVFPKNSLNYKKKKNVDYEEIKNTTEMDKKIWKTIKLKWKNSESLLENERLRIRCPS